MATQRKIRVGPSHNHYNRMKQTIVKQEKEDAKKDKRRRQRQINRPEEKAKCSEKRIANGQYLRAVRLPTLTHQQPQSAS